MRNYTESTKQIHKQENIHDVVPIPLSKVVQMLKESESEDLKYRDKIDPRWPKNHKYWFTKTEFLVLQFGFYDSHHRAPAGVELYLGILTDFNLNFHLRFPQPCQLFQQTYFLFKKSISDSKLLVIVNICIMSLYPVFSYCIQLKVLSWRFQF